MKERRIFFNAEDGMELAGIISEPENKTNKIVVSIHGMTSNCLKKREYKLAKAMTQNRIAYFSFSNRGHDLMSFGTLSKEQKICGTVYEEVLDSIYDVIGALKTVKKMGYTDVYIQGHSLGSTKVVYSYQKLKKQDLELSKMIKAVILLSLIDIPRCQKIYVGENYKEFLDYAEAKEKQGKQMEIMPLNSFISPISVKNYLRYVRDNQEIDFAKYHDSSYEFKELNSIDVPLFMRWGDQKEMIEQEPEKLVELLKHKIHNPNLNINYIKGADHSYHGKEEILAEQILKFLLTK